MEFAGDMLQVLVTEPNAGIRGRAAWALGRLHYKGAHDELLRCLKAGEAEVRTWSAWALGELGFYSDLPVLTRVAKREVDHEVRRAIFGALRKLRLEPTRSHINQVARLLSPPPTRGPEIRRIVEDLASLEWPKDRSRIVELRKELRNADPPYFTLYMEWVRRRPTLEQAATDPRYVYGG